MPSETYPAPGTNGAELEAFYRSWRILELLGETVATMPPEWLRILEIARNLMLGRPLPGLELPDALNDLLTPPEPTFTTEVRTQRKRRIVYPVTGDTTVMPLRNVLDLPQVTLPDMMLQTLNQELFEYRLISGGVNGLYNVDSGPAEEDYDEIVEVRVPTGGLTRKKRQKVYALFDVSNSMRDANKAIFAKALLLSYLVVAYEEGAKLYLRTFANTIHSRIDCIEKEQFPELAQRILRVAPDGGTDIKGALDAAIGDLRAIDNYNTLEHLGEAPPTEILLVSDCESYEVPVIPRGIRLHTVHLKGGRMMTAYREGFERIRAESKTFTEIDTSRLGLPESTRDRWLLEQDRPVRERATALVSGAAIATPEAERAEALRNAYERMRETGRRGKGKARKVDNMTARPSFNLDLGALWRTIVAAIRRAIRRPAPDWDNATVEHPQAPLGMKFRQRR